MSFHHTDTPPPLTDRALLERLFEISEKFNDGQEDTARQMAEDLFSGSADNPARALKILNMLRTGSGDMIAGPTDLDEKEQEKEKAKEEERYRTLLALENQAAQLARDIATLQRDLARIQEDSRKNKEKIAFEENNLRQLNASLVAFQQETQLLQNRLQDKNQHLETKTKEYQGEKTLNAEIVQDQKDNKTDQTTQDATHQDTLEALQRKDPVLVALVREKLDPLTLSHINIYTALPGEENWERHRLVLEENGEYFVKSPKTGEKINIKDLPHSEELLKNIETAKKAGLRTFADEATVDAFESNVKKAKTRYDALVAANPDDKVVQRAYESHGVSLDLKDREEALIVEKMQSDPKLLKIESELKTLYEERDDIARQLAPRARQEDDIRNRIRTADKRLEEYKSDQQDIEARQKALEEKILEKERALAETQTEIRNNKETQALFQDSGSKVKLYYDYKEAQNNNDTSLAEKLKAIINPTLFDFIESLLPENRERARIVQEAAKNSSPLPDTGTGSAADKYGLSNPLQGLLQPKDPFNKAAPLPHSPLPEQEQKPENTPAIHTPAATQTH